MNRNLAALAAAVAGTAGLALATAGCAGGTASAPQQPTARMERIGNAAVPSVVLTPLGADRIGVRTAPALTAGHSLDAVVPYSALLYEPDGAAAVYVNTGPLTYTRYLVSVDYITGSQVFVKPGTLAAGAKVVSQGAEELLGVQNGVGEER